MGMTLAEAAKALDVSVSLLRRYEREFNLNFARDDRNRRILTEQDLNNIRIILSFRDQNMSLEEIRATLSGQLVSAETETAGPDIRDVLAAVVARQDELEKIVQAQGAAISRLSEENAKLTALNTQLVLQIEAPKDSPHVKELGTKVDELEARLQASEASLDASTKDEMIRKLQRRLLDLEAAVATEIGTKSDEEEGLLDELARTIQAQVSQQNARKWWEFWR